MRNVFETSYISGWFALVLSIITACRKYVSSLKPDRTGTLGPFFGTMGNYRIHYLILMLEFSLSSFIVVNIKFCKQRMYKWVFLIPKNEKLK